MTMIAQKALRFLSFKLADANRLCVSGLLLNREKGLILGPILPDKLITAWNSNHPCRPFNASMIKSCANRNLALYQIDVIHREYLPESSPVKLNWNRSLSFSEGTQLYIGGFYRADFMITIIQSYITMFPISSPGNLCDDKYMLDSDVKNAYSMSLPNMENISELLGSPIVNKSGDIMGILGKYGMIPIDSLYLTYQYMDKSNILTVDYPTPAFLWSPGVRDIMRYKTTDESNYGIYTASVLPDSFVDGLKKGDIITHIEFNESEVKDKYSADIAFFDRYGFVSIVTIKKKCKLFGHDYDTKHLITNRRICIDELFDSISGKFRVQIIRDLNVKMLTCEVMRKPGKPRKEKLDSFSYEEYTFREASLDEVCKRYKKVSDWYNCHIMCICNNTVYWIDCFTSLRDLINAIKNNTSSLVIETETEKLIVIWANV